MLLSQYNSNYQYSRGRIVTNIWALFGVHLVRMLPCGISGGRFFNQIRISTLRVFGAKIGGGVVLNPCRVHFPWNLYIGENTWIGENCEIYNLGVVRIGDNVCVSQGVYFCTGSHDYKRPTFDLIVKPISVEDGAWICARSILSLGVTVGAGAVVGIGSVVTCDVTPMSIVKGNPAEKVRERAVFGGTL